MTDDPECVVSHERLSNCALCGVFTEAQNRVNEVFVRTSLQDLLTPKAETAQRLPPPPVLN